MLVMPRSAVLHVTARWCHLRKRSRPERLQVHPLTDARVRHARQCHGGSWQLRVGQQCAGPSQPAAGPAAAAAAAAAAAGAAAAAAGADTPPMLIAAAYADTLPAGAWRPLPAVALHEACGAVQAADVAEGGVAGLVLGVGLEVNVGVVMAGQQVAGVEDHKVIEICGRGRGGALVAASAAAPAGAPGVDCPAGCRLLLLSAGGRSSL